jgi:hypothetical protein
MRKVRASWWWVLAGLTIGLVISHLPVVGVGRSGADPPECNMCDTIIDDDGKSKSRRH